MEGAKGTCPLPDETSSMARLAKNLMFAALKYSQSDPASMSKEDWLKFKFPGLTFEQLLESENYSLYLKARREWEYAMQRALAVGGIGPEEADQKGLNLEPGHKPLTDLPLYHVTTAKDRVVLEGLKTRTELKQNLGSGLGGGTSDAISFTTDLDTAKGILSNMREAMAFCKGDLTFEDLYEMAKTGKDARHPWLPQWLKYHGSKQGEITEDMTAALEGYKIDHSWLPKKVEEKAKDGWEPIPDSKWPHGNRNDLYTKWKKKLNPQEAMEDKFHLFKTWSFFRDGAGGPLDPLYFSSDPNRLATIPEDQLAILEFKAKKNAYGNQLSGLSEWRTYSGEAVEFVREVPPDNAVASWVRATCRFANRRPEQLR